MHHYNGTYFGTENTLTNIFQVLFIFLVNIFVLKILFTCCKKVCKNTPVIEDINYQVFPEQNLEDSCCICQDKLATFNTVKLECNHIYHTTCLDNWIKNNYNCCLCRKRVVIEEHYLAIN